MMTNPNAVVLAEADRALVLDGHAFTRSQAITDARTYLTNQGKRAFDVDEALVDRQGLVVQAWWGGDAIGFVGEQHPGAQPVTVVNLPGDPRQAPRAEGIPPRSTGSVEGTRHG